MNAFDYFMSYYNCSTREELSKKIQNFGSDLPIPPHRCAHPKQKIFNSITEIKILDFVPTTRDNHLICLCSAKKFEYSFNFNDILFEDVTIYDEFFYLHLEDIIVCVPSQKECQYNTRIKVDDNTIKTDDSGGGGSF